MAVERWTDDKEVGKRLAAHRLPFRAESEPHDGDASLLRTIRQGGRDFAFRPRGRLRRRPPESGVYPVFVQPDTLFPFVVGTGLWSRAIIEILFLLWRALALANPSFRPPRSWLLLLLAAGLGASLLSACFGVSLQRSVRSNYERMQGMVDQAH